MISILSQFVIKFNSDKIPGKLSKKLLDCNLGGGTVKKSIPTLKFPKSTQTFLHFFTLLIKLSKFSHKTIPRCIGGKHMVTYDTYIQNYCYAIKPEKFEKKFALWVKIVNIALNFLKLT